MEASKNHASMDACHLDLRKTMHALLLGPEAGALSRTDSSSSPVGGANKAAIGVGSGTNQYIGTAARGDRGARAPRVLPSKKLRLNQTSEFSFLQKK